MNKLTALWDKIKQSFMDIVTPSIDGIISIIDKAEAALEVAIAKETRALEVLQRSEDVIKAAKALKNVEIDRAYKLLHNVGTLTR